MRRSRLARDTCVSKLENLKSEIKMRLRPCSTHVVNEDCGRAHTLSHTKNIWHHIIWIERIYQEAQIRIQVKGWRTHRNTRRTHTHTEIHAHESLKSYGPTNEKQWLQICVDCVEGDFQFWGVFARRFIFFSSFFGFHFKKLNASMLVRARNEWKMTEYCLRPNVDATKSKWFCLQFFFRFISLHERRPFWVLCPKSAKTSSHLGLLFIRYGLRGPNVSNLFE